MLKRFIQRLLDTRTTPARAGHSAMPSSTPTTISSPTSITSWGTITTFTAPDDGYVTFHGRSMAGAAAQIASLPLENNPTVITATQDNYQGMSCNLPVVKGKTVEVYGSNIENIVVSFNRLIGGGCNSYIWRALSCLRALSNYLPKVSSRAKSRGLEVNPSRRLQKLPSLLRTDLTTRRPKMAGSELGTLRLHGSRFTPQLHLSHQEQMVQPYVTFPSGKERQLFATSLRTMGKQKASLSPQSVQTNLQTGGALC